MSYKKSKANFIKNKSQLSKNFEQLLRKHSISPVALSKEINCPLTTLYHLLKKGDDIKISTAKKIADFFKIQIHDLIISSSATFSLKEKVKNKNFTQNIKEALIILMKKHNLSKEKFSELTAIGRQTIGDILNKRSSDSKASTLIKVAEFFNVTIDALIGDLPLSAKKKDIRKVKKTKLDTNYFPVVSWEQLATFLSNHEEQKHLNVESVFVSYFAQPRFSKIFAVHAPHRTPFFNKDTVLLINPDKNYSGKFHLYLGHCREHKLYLFISKENKGHYYYTTPENPDVGVSPIELVGYIVKIVL